MEYFIEKISKAVFFLQGPQAKMALFWRTLVQWFSTDKSRPGNKNTKWLLYGAFLWKVEKTSLEEGLQIDESPQVRVVEIFLI